MFLWAVHFIYNTLKVSLDRCFSRIPMRLLDSVLVSEGLLRSVVSNAQWASVVLNVQLSVSEGQWCLA